MAEALGDVSSQADIGAGEAMFVVDVTVTESADRDDGASLIGAMFANKLGHRPGFE